MMEERPTHVVSLLLDLARETMLENLNRRPLDLGNVPSRANTVFHASKHREGQRLGRVLDIAEYRGSDRFGGIVPFRDRRGRRALPRRSPKSCRAEMCRRADLLGQLRCPGGNRVNLSWRTWVTQA